MKINKKFLKYIVFVAYLIIFSIIYIKTTRYLNLQTYGVRSMKMPHNAIIGLLRFYRLTKDVYVQSKIVNLIGFNFFLPNAFCFLSGLFILGFLKKRRINKRNDELEGIKGKEAWAQENDLEVSDYAFTWKDLLEPKKDPENKDSQKLYVVYGQSADAKLDSSDPQHMKTKSFGKRVIGCNIEKFNSLTIGGIGSGKGAGTIVPTLLTFLHSVICYDPAKENFNKTAGYRQTLGKVQYFDPADRNSTMHFNPLDWIRRTVSYITVDIDNMSHLFFPSSGGGNGEDKYWKESARRMFIIYLGYILLFFPKKKQNLTSMYSLAEICNWKDDPFYYENMIARLQTIEEEKAHTDPSSNDYRQLCTEQEFLQKKVKKIQDHPNKLEEMKENYEDQCKKPIDLTCVFWKLQQDFEYKLNTMDKKNRDNDWKFTLLRHVKTTSKNLEMGGKSQATLSTVFSFLDNALAFFNEENVASLMEDTSFTPEDLQLKENPISIYLCIKNADTERCKTFVQLFLSSILNQLTDDYEKDYKHHLLFILDEFSQLGYIDSVYRSISYVRKYHISFMLIIQSISQLEDRSAYGKEKTDAMLENISVVDVKRVSNPATAKWVIEHLGDQTIIMDNVSSTYKAKGFGKESTNTGLTIEKRPLLFEQELMHMDPSEEILLLVGFKANAKVKKLQYFEHPELLKRSMIKYNPGDVVAEVDPDDPYSNIKPVGDNEDFSSDDSEEPKVITETEVETEPVPVQESREEGGIPVVSDEDEKAEEPSDSDSDEENWNNFA